MYLHRNLMKQGQYWKCVTALELLFSEQRIDEAYSGPSSSGLSPPSAGDVLPESVSLHGSTKTFHSRRAEPAVESNHFSLVHDTSSCFVLFFILQCKVPRVSLQDGPPFRSFGDGPHVQLSQFTADLHCLFVSLLASLGWLLRWSLTSTASLFVRELVAWLVRLRYINSHLGIC